MYIKTLDFKKTISRILETKLGIAEKLEELKKSLNETISKIMEIKQRKSKPFSIDSNRIKDQKSLKGVQFSIFSNIVLQELDQKKRRLVHNNIEFPPVNRTIIDEDTLSVLKKPFSGMFTTFLSVTNGTKPQKLILSKSEGIG